MAISSVELNYLPCCKTTLHWMKRYLIVFLVGLWLLPTALAQKTVTIPIVSFSVPGADHLQLCKQGNGLGVATKPTG